MTMPPCPSGEWGLRVIRSIPHYDNGWMVNTLREGLMKEGKKILSLLWEKEALSWNILTISCWTKMSMGRVGKMFPMFPLAKTSCTKTGFWIQWVGAWETKISKHDEISPRLGRNKERWWASFQGVSLRDITLVILSLVGNVLFKGSGESLEPSQGHYEYASRCVLRLAWL